MHNGNNFRFNDSTESCRLEIRTVFMRLFYLFSLSLSLRREKSFPVTSITLELEPCPARFPSCRRNSLLKSNPFKILFLAERLIFNLFQIMIHPTIPKFPKFSSSFPSLHTISLNFSLNCFSLPPRFCPTCHWRVLSNEAKGSSIARVTRYRA